MNLKSCVIKTLIVCYGEGLELLLSPSSCIAVSIQEAKLQFANRKANQYAAHARACVMVPDRVCGPRVGLLEYCRITYLIRH